jgi:hypothetical protein
VVLIFQLNAVKGSGQLCAFAASIFFVSCRRKFAKEKKRFVGKVSIKLREAINLWGCVILRSRFVRTMNNTIRREVERVKRTDENNKEQ